MSEVKLKSNNIDVSKYYAWIPLSGLSDSEIMELELECKNLQRRK